VDVFFYFIISYYDQQNAQLFHKLSYSYMFRHYRVIVREFVVSTLQGYTSVSNAVQNTQQLHSTYLCNLAR